MNRAYDVFLNEVLVGLLIESDTGQVSFKFVDAYLQMNNRPVLGQYFEDNLIKVYSGKNNQLPVFFSNIIPEKGLLRRLIENGLDNTDDLSILEALGQDLPGSIIVKPSIAEAYDFSEEINESFTLEKNKVEESIIRFSLAGIQLKFSVRREDERLTLSSSNDTGDWIVKIDSPDYPNLVENEFVIMKWAEKSGFDVPDCYLQSADTLSEELREYAPESSKVFLIRRYDRKDGRRIHQEDIAQVVNLQPDLKYDHITYEKLGILINNIVGEEGYYEFIRRLTFMIASGNTDAHQKNWSIIYQDGINATLSPLYDQVFTLAWGKKKVTTQVALKFVSLRNIYQINEETFERLSKKTGMDIDKTILVVKDCLENICHSWLTLEEKTIFPESHLTELKNHWNKSALLKKYSYIFD